mgnify:CR=1 FL=1
MLADYGDSERLLASELVEQHYDLLKDVARRRRRSSGRGSGLQTTEILHESFIRMERGSGWADAMHFIRSATLAMRHVIVDSARARLRDKRGGGVEDIPLDEATLPEYGETPEQIVALADLLERLGSENPRWMRVVDARYFAGMTEQETADVLGVSDRTVRRDWTSARAWLAGELGTGRAV